MPYTQKDIKSNFRKTYAPINTMVTIISISDTVAIVDNGKMKFPCKLEDLGDRMVIIEEPVKELPFDLFNQR